MSEIGRVKFWKEKGFGFLTSTQGDIYFNIKSLPKGFSQNYNYDNAIFEFSIGTREDRTFAKDMVYIDNRLPNDTRWLLGYNLLEKDMVENFSLRLNKCASFDEDKFKFFKRDRKTKNIELSKAFPENGFKISDICNQHREMIIKTGLKLNKPIRLKPVWRLIVGLGNESVYETGMTLHYIYGFPYIPGSAIKGVLRNWVINMLFGEHVEKSEEKNLEDENSNLSAEKSEAKALKDEGFCYIFGSPKKSSIGEHQGWVSFFDAYPTDVPKIEFDVMNPHYGQYYTDETNTIPPADHHDPRPIFFLTVEETPFEFIFGIKEKNNKPLKINDLEEKLPLEWVEHWLKEALSKHGIGAKTAVGYGYME